MKVKDLIDKINIKNIQNKNVYLWDDNEIVEITSIEEREKGIYISGNYDTADQEYGKLLKIIYQKDINHNEKI